MPLTPAIQESLAAIVCFNDDSKVVGVVRGLVPLRAFDAYFRELVEVALKFRDRFNEAPGEHTVDLVDDLIKDHKDSEKLYRRLLTSLFEIKDSINSDYVISQAKKFSRQQTMKAAVMQTFELIQKGDEDSLDDAERTLLKSFSTSSDLFEPGTVLSDASKSLQFLDQTFESMPTGIKELDQLGLGPSRGEIHLFIAPIGRGKSWWFINLGKWCLLHRFRVLHITLEMPETQVCQRYIQALFSISKRKKDYVKQIFELDELGNFAGIDVEDIPHRPSLEDKGIRKTLIDEIDKKIKRRPPLVVKRFPTGNLTVKELEGYLDALETFHSFIPDLVIIDYPDLMTIDPSNYRLDLGNTIKELRGVGVKRNVAVAVASQVNREGMGAKVISSKHLSEDISKGATADVVISYNQTEDEEPLGLARLHVVKGRKDEDRFTVLISQSYGLGQFCVDSVRMLPRYWDVLNESSRTDEEDEEEEKPKKKYRKRK
jgi:hypothetical protein